jgi:hypothetical protein
MCDINKKTEYTTRTVYKVVHKFDDNYYALYSGLPITIGKVDAKWKPSKIQTIDIINACSFNSFSRDSHFYNSNMIGKTSGFADLKAAKILKQDTYQCGGIMVILEIKFGGEIWEGSSRGILDDDFDDYIVYAGTEILSFKEIKS